MAGVLRKVTGGDGLVIPTSVEGFLDCARDDRVGARPRGDTRDLRDDG